MRGPIWFLVAVTFAAGVVLWILELYAVTVYAALAVIFGIWVVGRTR